MSNTPNKRVYLRGKPVTIRNYRLLAVLGAGFMLGVMLVLGIGATQGEAATLLKGSFRGQAYATFANAEAGPVATQLGRSAFQPCPCNGTDGKTLSNTVDSVATADNGRTLRANGTLSTVFTEKTSSSARVKNTSKVTGLNALDRDPNDGRPGLIKADAIKAVANTSANATTLRSTPTGSEFVNLRIAGEPIRADVAANTRVDLDGIGYVLLKSVKKDGDGERLSKITVDMLTIVVTQANSFDLPVGSRIVVAHAVSGYSRTEPNVIVGGQAYAATALTTTDAFKNRVGKAAYVVIGCEGTNGKTRTNNVNTLDVGNVLSSGTGVTTAFGGPTSTGTVAKTTARVEDLELLNTTTFPNGLIRADAITAVAKDTFRNGQRFSSTQGSRFVGLNVAGAAVPVDVEPNTRLVLPGVGYVIVNEQKLPATGSTARTQVNGLHIFVTRNNTLGVPVGTEIIVAHADSTAVRF